MKEENTKDTLMILDSDSYHMIIDLIHDGLCIVDENKIIRSWNKAAERITGYTAIEVIGKTCSDGILNHVGSSGKYHCETSCPLSVALTGGISCQEVEGFMLHKKGYAVPVSVRYSRLTDIDGNLIGAVEVFSDISAYKSIEVKVKELEEMALLDNLTRLANRNFIERELYLRFEEQKRFGIPFGFLFIDIDHFKQVNDKYGHDTGDMVLKVVADTLVKNSRPYDVIGRWGGEEFVGIIRNVSCQQLAFLGNRLITMVEETIIPIDNSILNVTISIGATLVKTGDTVDSLIKRADSLLYESKRAGRNCLRWSRKKKTPYSLGMRKDSPVCSPASNPSVNETT